MNLVECSFGILTRKQIRAASTTAPQLIAAIKAFIAGHNDHAKPFVWTKSAEQILGEGGSARDFGTENRQTTLRKLASTLTNCSSIVTVCPSCRMALPPSAMTTVRDGMFTAVERIRLKSKALTLRIAHQRERHAVRPTSALENVRDLGRKHLEALRP